MTVDPDNLTSYQRVLLEGYPAFNVPFQRFSGPLDRAEAVAAGAVKDPELLGLLEKLGPDCASVDDASTAVSQAAEQLARQSASMRGKPGWTEQALLMGTLRTVAANLWRLESKTQFRT